MFNALLQNPVSFILWVLAILIALSTHEFSHALVATWLGDPTAKRMGRLTLNPAAHVDLLGFLMLVTVGFGWGKPVPFNPYNLRNQKWGPVLIALAGPAMNLLIATVAGFIWIIVAPQFSADNLLLTFIWLTVRLNLMLLIFNLIPVPPLDGSKLLLALVRGRPSGEKIRFFLDTKGPLILIGLIVTDMFLNLNLFGWIDSPIRAFMGLFGMV